MAEGEPPAQIQVQSTDNYFPRNRQLSNHRNYYQIAEDQAESIFPK